MTMLYVFLFHLLELLEAQVLVERRHQAADVHFEFFRAHTRSFLRNVTGQFPLYVCHFFVGPRSRVTLFSFSGGEFVRAQYQTQNAAYETQIHADFFDDRHDFDVEGETKV